MVLIISCLWNAPLMPSFSSAICKFLATWTQLAWRSWGVPECSCVPAFKWSLKKRFRSAVNCITGSDFYLQNGLFMHTYLGCRWTLRACEELAWPQSETLLEWLLPEAVGAASPSHLWQPGISGWGSQLCVCRSWNRRLKVVSNGLNVLVWHVSVQIVLSLFSCLYMRMKTSSWSHQQSSALVLDHRLSAVLSPAPHKQYCLLLTLLFLSSPLAQAFLESLTLLSLCISCFCALVFIWGLPTVFLWWIADKPKKTITTTHQVIWVRAHK